jgi:hypothetical protein
MDERQIKFFKAWVIFFIVGAVCGGIAGFFASGILGSFLGIIGADVEIIKLACVVAGFIVGIPISFVCYRWSVKRFILPQILVESGQTSESSMDGEVGPW